MARKLKPNESYALGELVAYLETIWHKYNLKQVIASAQSGMQFSAKALHNPVYITRILIHVTPKLTRKEKEDLAEIIDNLPMNAFEPSDLTLDEYAPAYIGNMQALAVLGLNPQMTGKVIRETRESLDLPVSEAAERADVVPQTWYEYERGTRRLRASTLDRIAKAFGMTRADLETRIKTAKE